MRVTTLVHAALLTVLTGAPVFAQQTQTSGTPKESSLSQPGNNEAPLNLPVSLDKIREGLAQPPPAEPLKGLNEQQPTFRLEIREQQKFDELVSKLKFDKGGPPVPGGIDAYEQYQRAFPRINNPLAQPYAGFSTGEIMTLSVEALIEKYVAKKMVNMIGDTLRAQAEREAREEVARSLAQFWASQSAVPAPAALPKE
jgi:hypothetical protein